MKSPFKEEIAEIKIANTVQFLEGQLELYKIEFARTGNNKYLDVMNELNKSIEIIDFLNRALIYRTKQYSRLKTKI